MQRRDVGSVVLPSVHEFSSRARAQACRSGFRKPQPHYPKYSSARSGRMQFSSGFCQLDVGEGKGETTRRETARSKTREEEAAGPGGGNGKEECNFIPVAGNFTLLPGQVSRAQLVLVENVARRFSLPRPALAPKAPAHENADGFTGEIVTGHGVPRPRDFIAPEIFRCIYTRTCVRAYVRRCVRARGANLSGRSTFAIVHLLTRVY